MSSLLSQLRGQAQVPTDESWIRRSIGGLEGQLREQLAGVGELTGAVIRRGLTLITDYGGLVIEGPHTDPATGNPDGTTFQQFAWGTLPDDPRYNHPDGSRQMGFLAHLDDGTIALSIAETNATDGQYGQACILWDRVATPGGVVAADGNSGRGLARPHLGQFAGNGDTNITRWPSTTATSWTAIWAQYWEIQNPKLSWNTQLYIPAGCTGQFRMSYGSTVIGTSAAVAGGTSGTFSQWFGGRVTLPGDIGDEEVLTVEAIVTAGAGEIRLNFLQLKGDQS